MPKKDINDRNEYRRQWRARRKSNGLCLDCGLPVSSDNYCHACLFRKQTRRRALKIECLEAYGGLHCSCKGCDESHWEFLSIDHIHGDGAAHRRAIGRKGGGGFYLWLKQNNFPDGFRVLCMNCNASRGYYGYCPHELES